MSWDPNSATVEVTEDAKVSANLSFQALPEVISLRSQLQADRRHLHAHPELSFQEFETAKYVASQLRSYGSVV